jgi:hypothetical protein
MKNLISLMMLLALPAFAADDCKASCKEMQDECANQCTKVVKKKNPGQMPACLNQCKIMSSECEKDCGNDSSKKN